MQSIISVSYCKVCASIWEDRPQALASGNLPYIRTHNTIHFLFHIIFLQHAFALCALSDI